MVRALRRLVSTNKRRFVDAARGLDLDLSYIIDGRLLAMGYPSEGARSLIRNPLSEVQAFFDAFHAPGTVKVFNLCIEPGWRGYALPQAAEVVELPLWDGQAPPLHVVHDFCVSACAWLGASPRHCVAVHCKAGKGRTGALIAALLLFLLQAAPQHLPEDLRQQLQQQQRQLAPAADGAPRLHAAVLPVLGYWAARRTLDGQGLTISSQRRYVSYYASLLDAGKAAPPPSQPVCLLRVHVSGLCQRLPASTAFPFGACASATATAPRAPSAQLPEEGAVGGAGEEGPAAWAVPPLTVAVWARARGQHTPSLLAYGASQPGTHVPAADPAAPRQQQHGALQLLPDGSLCLDLASGVDAAPGQPGAPPLLDGDFKVQVFEGCRRPQAGSGAAFKGKGSRLLCWLHTAFLHQHHLHRPHALRPPKASVPATSSGAAGGAALQESGGPAALQGTSGAAAAAVDGEGGAGGRGGSRRVEVQVGELDKVDKRLRRDASVGVVVVYEPG